MPLDFSKDAPPPTLGKRPRTDVNYVVDEDAGLTRSDIRMGLRTVGGTMKVRSNPWDIEKQERYVAHYASQEVREEQDRKEAEKKKFKVKPDPEQEKIDEYINYWAQQQTGITPGWLPQNYTPFSMEAARRLVRFLKSGDYRTAPEHERKRHHTPLVRVMGSEDSPSIGVSGARLIKDDGDTITPVVHYILHENDLVGMDAHALVERLFREINAMIVKVGMEQKNIERRQRKARVGPVQAEWSPNPSMLRR